MKPNLQSPEFDRFKELTRRIVKVPKGEVEDRPNVGTGVKKGRPVEANRREKERKEREDADKA